MFVVCVEFQIEPGQTDVFLAAVRKNAEQSFNQEVGCQQFDVCQDRHFPNSVFLYEVYDDVRRSKHTNLHCITVHLIKPLVVWS